MNTTMTFNEWIDGRWYMDPNPLSELDKQWLTFINNDRQKTLSRIDKHFIKEPKFVVCLTRDAFFSLPEDPEIKGWPNITVIEKWLERNTKDEWMLYDSTTFIFSSEEDAFALKMRWL